MGQLVPDTIAYHFQARIRIRGALDVGALEDALAVIIERHESLRTVFVEHDGAPCQVIQAPWRPSLPVVDLSGLPDSMRGGYVDVLVDAELRKRIDVSQLPLVRWLLIREAADLHVLLHVEHHLTHDGWSFRLFMRELAALYNARKRSNLDAGLVPPRQYREFCQDERQWLDGAEGRSERAWWRERLTGWPAYGNSIAPGVAERRAAPTFQGHSISIPIPPAVLGSVAELAMTERATLFEAMVAVFAAVVRERSGSDRIVIGTGVANRDDVGTESVIGMLVNTVPLRFGRSGSLRDRLEEARQEVREACRHGRTPLSIMVQDVRPDRLTKALPFLQTTFSFQNALSRELAFDGLEVEITEALSNGTAKFDLNVMVMFDDETNLRRGGRMVVEFADDVGSETEIAAFCDSYLQTLGSWAIRPQLTLRQLRAGGEDAAVPDDLAYWRRRLADLADARLLGRSYRNARSRGCRARLDRPIRQGLPEADLLAGYALLLSRHTSCADVLFGYLPQGKADPLPLRLRVDETQSLGSFRGEAEAAIQGALAHSAPGVAAILDVLRGAREENQPLLETAFAVGPNPQMPAVDLAWAIIRGDRADTLVLDWDEGRFERAAIERLSDHFARLLEACADAPMRDAPMMSPEEVSTILAWSRGPTPEYPARTVHGQFEYQAAVRPLAVALRCEGRDVTYGELDRRANRLAAALRARGVEKGAAVGVIAARTPDVVAALLGILKAGAAYVPIESDHPAERQRLIAAESRVSIVLADTPQAATTGEGTAVLSIGALIADTPDPPAIEAGAGPDDRCYILFTSGSTGTPKGVPGTHRAVVRLVCNTNYVEISSSDRFLRFAPLSFDVSTFEIWGALLNGATLVLPPCRVGLEELAEIITRERVTIAFATPSLFKELVESHGAVLASLRFLFSGGEVVPTDAVRRLFASPGACRPIVAYGPTEATTFSTSHEVGREDEIGDRLPIGRPIAHSNVYILDSLGRPTPVGVPGEIYCGGQGVFGAYIDRPALTAERFMPNPYCPGDILFRSGDYGAWDDQGRIDFLGRADDQVKIRGIRIEPGEVEAQLRTVPRVRDCAVVVDGTQRDKRLLALVVPAPGARLSEGDLLDTLRVSLPAYMIPAGIIVLEALPLLPSGKLDRKKALRLAQLGAAAAVEVAQPHPGTLQIVRETWVESLGTESFGPDDDFFAVGGHSLAAMRIMSRLTRKVGRLLPLSLLFEAPTVRRLAAAIDRVQAAPADSAHAWRQSDTVEPIIVPGAGECADGTITPSYGQQRLWALDRLDGASGAYNIPLAARVRGRLDVRALANALTDVVRRHAPLRTLAGERDGELVGRLIAPDNIGELLVIEQVHSEDDLGPRLAEITAAPFNLSEELPIRARLLRVSEDDAALAIVIHHSAADGTSLPVLARELGTLYGGCREGRSTSLPALPYTYADLAAWSRRTREQGGELDRQVAWWRDRLSGAPELTALPTDLPRRAERARRAAYVPVVIAPGLGTRLSALARSQGTTTFAVVLAAFGALLSSLSRQQDLVIGAASVARDHPGSERLVGFFVNTLALRLDLSPTDLAGLLRRADAAVREGLAHQHAPFEQVVEALAVARSLSHTPVFQVMCGWQSQEPAELLFEGVITESVNVPLARAKFDLNLSLAPQGDEGIRGVFEYDADLFRAETIGRWASLLIHWLDLLASRALDTPLDRLPLLPQDEEHLVLRSFNPPAWPAPTATVPEIFEAHAARTPGATALIAAGTGMTYAELDTRSNRLARLLLARGAGPEVVIAVALPRSAEMIVALLAILKSGAAYLALDPLLPPARITFMLNDSRAQALITFGPQGFQLPSQVAVVRIDDSEIRNELGRLSAAPITDAERPEQLEAGNLAYLVYTSGTTGTPKAVETTHANVVALAHAPSYCRLDERSVILQLAPLDFDASTFEIWGALLNGGRLVLASSGRVDLERVASLVHETGVNTAWLTAGLFRVAVETTPRLFAPLEQLLTGGDVVDPEAARVVLERHPQLELLNGYGPTETTTFAATWKIRAEDCGPSSIPIGRPLRGYAIYILDAGMRPVPVGAWGEIHVAGAGLARGYRGRPELTAERFVPNPFGPGERMYRTGDLGRWRADGVIEFLGRVDDQVKLRGFRIEPGEIEVVMRSVTGVGDAAVTARQVAGETRLVAYWTPSPDHSTLSTMELRARLGELLPDYMIPSRFVMVERLPLTDSGKIDRRSLPDTQVGEKAAFVAPADECEALLCRLFAELTGASRVSATDSFFDLGGHSLLALKLVSRVRQEAGLETPLRDVFRFATPQGLAAVLKNAAPALSITSPYVVALRRPGTERPLFCIHPGRGSVTDYRHLTEHIRASIPVYGIQARNLASDAPPHQSIAAMTSEYIGAIREVQPLGPYRLLGWSFGGVLAAEIACELQSNGTSTSELVLLDPLFIDKKGALATADVLIDTLHLFDITVSPERFEAMNEVLYRSVVEREPIPRDIEHALVMRVAQNRVQAVLLLSQHEARPFSARTLLVHSTGRAAGSTAWASLVQGSMTEVEAPIDHGELGSAHAATFLGPLIDRFLRR